MARKAGSHAETTRPRVREAALKLFAQHGYAAVSMRQIAGEVGVQAGALYNYTPDKQAMLFDLMRGHMEHLLTSLGPVRDLSDPMAALVDFSRFHIQYHLERPDLVFIAYMELRNLSPDNFAVVEGMRRQYEDRLEAILKAGQGAGVFRVGDTKVATMAIIAMLTGITTWYRDAGRLSRDEIEAIYLEMVSGAVGATVSLAEQT